MKKISLFLVMLAVAVGANAQLLWKITGNGLERPSYMFGTEHVAPLSVIDNTPFLKDAIASVDELYGELSLDELASAALSPEIAAMTMAPADSTLSRVMTPAQLAEVDSVFMSITGAPAGITAMLDQFKPAMVGTLMLQIAAAKTIPDFDMRNPLDAAILRLGAENGKTVKGLESMKEQVRMLYGTPISKQVNDLLDDIHSDRSMTQILAEMNEAYLAGDLDKLHSMMIDDASGMNAETQSRIIDERNSAWVSLLLEELPTTSALIVVGAGHLPGPGGLIQLFRNAGYTVEPL